MNGADDRGDPGQERAVGTGHADATTVEALVRKQLADALGGRRGMVEAAAPMLLFTITWLTSRQLEAALYVSVGVALVLLLVRVVQRSSVQFVFNENQQPELATFVREGDVVMIPQGYHPNVAAPGGQVNFLWMMAAIREDEDRQFGVVNVHPDFAAGGSGLDPGKARK